MLVVARADGALHTVEMSSSGHHAAQPFAASVGVEPALAIGPSEYGGERSPGRHCHSTLSLAAIGCHCLGIYTVILRSLLSFSV